MSKNDSQQSTVSMYVLTCVCTRVNTCADTQYTILRPILTDCLISENENP